MPVRPDDRAASPPPDFGRKYRALAPALLTRVWREASAIEPRPAEALKRAKRALHQLHSAFVQERELATAERALAELPDGADAVRVAATCRAILGCHASTRERLPQLERLHAELNARLGVPASVLDLGCGLQPFALPWSELPRSAPYHAREVDGRMVALVERWFAQRGQAGTARAIDLIGADDADDADGADFADTDGAALPRADVAFLFKLLPTLERQRTGGAGALLDRLRVRAAVLSFPTRSLGARAKGMREQYERFAEQLLAPRGWSRESFALGDEWFVVARPPR